MTTPTVDPAAPRRIALLTADPSYPLLDVDRQVTADALTRAGLDHDLVPWTAAVDWSSYDLVVVRSTWDYTTQLEPFLMVLEDIARHTTLLNPFDVIRWNVDKRYLRELSEAGFPVVPATYLQPGDDPARAISAVPPPVVVKPVVSAGAKNTQRHDDHQLAERHARHLLEAGATIMVQPYVPEVDLQGETGLVFLGGHYSHAFRKAPILAGPDGRPEVVLGDVLVERITPREATSDQIALAQGVVDWLCARFTTLLYARVDLLPTASGHAVLEVELVEPNLFFATTAHTADTFARHVTMWPSVA